MDCTEKTLKQNVVYKGRILTLYNDDVQCANGHISTREYVDHHGGASILAIDDEENIYLVEQYRYAYRMNMLEIPAGKLEGDEQPIVCAKRELKEEIGAVADDIKQIALIYPTPGYTNEPLYIFEAKGLKFGECHYDDGEVINVIKIPFKTALEKVNNGEIKDGKTVVAILKYALENK